MDIIKIKKILIIKKFHKQINQKYLIFNLNEKNRKSFKRKKKI